MRSEARASNENKYIIIDTENEDNYILATKYFINVSLHFHQNQKKINQ